MRYNLQVTKKGHVRHLFLNDKLSYIKYALFQEASTDREFFEFLERHDYELLPCT
jgi:hypothetical protein